MGGFLRKVVQLIVGDDARVRPEKKKSVIGKVTDRDLLKRESKIGGSLFGPVPRGHKREFFCLDESTWIWHEQWKDRKGVERQATVRYEIHAKGVLKVSEGPRYQFIEGNELHNFAEATRLYYEQTARQVYNRDPKTGLKFA